MNLSPVTEHTTSIMGIEVGLTLIAAALTFTWPQLGSSAFEHPPREPTPPFTALKAAPVPDEFKRRSRAMFT
jgi:hypothetical protein